MALSDEIRAQVKKTFAEAWSHRYGQIVPEPANLKLSNDAVEFELATVLYADLTGSTALVNSEQWQTAAEIYKTYLYAAAKIIRAEGGSITSYDGDRVMGIFIGESQCTKAVRAGLKISYAVEAIINPAFRKQYAGSARTIKHVVGIDASTIRAARTGVRGGNDIVWVGRAANFAAKLTEIKRTERTFITKKVFDRLGDGLKISDDGHEMWKPLKWTTNGDLRIYGTAYNWQI